RDRILHRRLCVARACGTMRRQPAPRDQLARFGGTRGADDDSGTRTDSATDLIEIDGLGQPVQCVVDESRDSGGVETAAENHPETVRGDPAQQNVRHRNGLTPGESASATPYGAAVYNAANRSVAAE